MIHRALVVWFGILGLAVLNGGVRNNWLSPRLGDTIGRAISTLLLCGLIVLATWLTIRWIAPVTRGEALRVGVLWVALTLIFEFGVGHYGFGKSWTDLLADYDVSRGRIWIAVLLVTLFAPRWAAGRRGLLDPAREAR